MCCPIGRLLLFLYLLIIPLDLLLSSLDITPCIILIVVIWILKLVSLLIPYLSPHLFSIFLLGSRGALLSSSSALSIPTITRGGLVSLKGCCPFSWWIRLPQWLSICRIAQSIFDALYARYFGKIWQTWKATHWSEPKKRATCLLTMMIDYSILAYHISRWAYCSDTLIVLPLFFIPFWGILSILCSWFKRRFLCIVWIKVKCWRGPICCLAILIAWRLVLLWIWILVEVAEIKIKARWCRLYWLSWGLTIWCLAWMT